MAYYFVITENDGVSGKRQQEYSKRCERKDLLDLDLFSLFLWGVEIDLH